ncbi:MAG: twin-arginine translocase TatA/TatE family subunit [Victivallaceae bacterium]
MIGWQELMVIFFIVLLLFGAKRIPEIARSLGIATREFKKAKDQIVKDSQEMMDAAEKHAEAEEKKSDVKPENKKS